MFGNQKITRFSVGAFQFAQYHQSTGNSFVEHGSSICNHHTSNQMLVILALWNKVYNVHWKNIFVLKWIMKSKKRPVLKHLVEYCPLWISNIEYFPFYYKNLAWGLIRNSCKTFVTEFTLNFEEKTTAESSNQVFMINVRNSLMAGVNWSYFYTSHVRRFIWHFQ